MKQLGTEPAFDKVICVGRRKVLVIKFAHSFQINSLSCVSTIFTFFDRPFFKVELPPDSGMEKVTQEEVVFDNLSQYSAVFPRCFH